MKLTALYESLTTGGIAMGNTALGTSKHDGGVFKPKGKERWYHQYSPMTLRHKLPEKDKELFKQKKKN